MDSFRSLASVVLVAVLVTLVGALGGAAYWRFELQTTCTSLCLNYRPFAECTTECMRGRW